jgi:hypothetical protein
LTNAKTQNSESKKGKNKGINKGLIHEVKEGGKNKFVLAHYSAYLAKWWAIETSTHNNAAVIGNSPQEIADSPRVKTYSSKAGAGRRLKRHREIGIV